MKKNALCFILSIGVTTSLLLCNSSEGQVKSLRKFDHAHPAWTSFLKKHVTVREHASTVDYRAIKKEPGELNHYLEELQRVSKEEFNEFSEKEKLAFLINAYNAFTIKLIVNRYPVKSIKKIGGVLKSPWKIEFFTLLGERMHLDQIEHELIRKKFNEPRIHSGLVCAAKGCPALRDAAYTAAGLEQELEGATLNFLADRNRNRYLPETERLELSSIFKWYEKDFVKKYGSLEAFLAPRIASNPDHQKSIREKKASITYLDYDWSLNESQ